MTTLQQVENMVDCWLHTSTPSSHVLMQWLYMLLLGCMQPPSLWITATQTCPPKNLLLDMETLFWQLNIVNYSMVHDIWVCWDLLSSPSEHRALTPPGWSSSPTMRSGSLTSRSMTVTVRPSLPNTVASADPSTPEPTIITSDCFCSCTSEAVSGVAKMLELSCILVQVLGHASLPWKST
jgi:hypothetical protein